MTFTTNNPRIAIRTVDLGANMTRIDVCDCYKGIVIAVIRPLDIKDDEGRGMYEVETKTACKTATATKAQTTINHLAGRRPA